MNDEGYSETQLRMRRPMRTGVIGHCFSVVAGLAAGPSGAVVAAVVYVIGGSTAGMPAVSA